MLGKIQKRIENLEKLKGEIQKIDIASKIIFDALNMGNKILFCGNGGSASDSNHLACEFISKFQKNRESLPAISLASNNSILTAIANDYSFDDVFARQVEGLGNKDDVLIAISTSGVSKNVVKAIEIAHKKGLRIIFLTGKNKINLISDVEINAPSEKTCEIQEMHIAIGHLICEYVENNL